jgi:type VI secretion system protein ImpF
MTLYGLNLLEKLTDDRGDEIAHSSVDRLKDSVARDVESLLNSRCGLREEALSAWPQSQHSVLSFGLKDFVSMCLSSEGDRAAICDDIRRCLQRHEPRLQEPVVDVSKAEGPGQRLHFSIQALLIAHDANEVVSFDAVLMPVSQRYQVQRSKGL